MKYFIVISEKEKKIIATKFILEKKLSEYKIFLIPK